MVLPPEALRLLPPRRTFHTPCGAGRMVLRIWGEERLEPLVLLHGGSGSWMHWLRNIETLSKVRRLIVPDLPGFGDSSPPDGGRDADVSAAPVALGLAQLLEGKPSDVCGFSFGALVGGFIAAQTPHRVRRLVIVGAPGLGLSAGMRLALRSWRNLPDPGEQREVHRHNLALIMLHDPAAVDDLALNIQAINLPRDRMQGLELVPNAGHWVQYEQPGAFEATLMRVLK